MAYKTDVSDAAWEFLAPYLTLMRGDAPPRGHALRDVFDALRDVVRTGCQWDMLPHDLPPRAAVYQPARRWVRAGVLEAAALDRRMILRRVEEREAQPTAAILDSRTPQSTPESGRRAGADGAKRKKGSKVHIAVGTRGHPLAPKVTAASDQDRTPVAERAARVQEVTGGAVELAFVDQEYTGEATAAAAGTSGIELEVVKHTEAKKGFVLLPRRWVVERSFAWLGRFRRLARDYERLAETRAGWHWLAFLTALLPRLGHQSA